MNIQRLIDLINGNLITTTSDLSREIKGGYGGDLMSDVLASIKPEAVLLTGLCNPQVVRTAMMADVVAIVFVRGKLPTEETILLGNKENLALISASLGMFELCGRLYQAGLPSFESPIMGGDCSCE